MGYIEKFVFDQLSFFTPFFYHPIGPTYQKIGDLFFSMCLKQFQQGLIPTNQPYKSFRVDNYITLKMSHFKDNYWNPVSNTEGPRGPKRAHIKWQVVKRAYSPSIFLDILSSSSCSIRTSRLVLIAFLFNFFDCFLYILKIHIWN